MEEQFTTTGSNTSFGINHSMTNVSAHTLFNDKSYQDFERCVRAVIPIIFGLIVVIGMLGNLLVIIIVLMNKKMWSTMNILILNLALADLCFIVFCVPFTAASYALPIWPFGEIWCKIVKFTLNISIYASVYTLVIMSLYRYLAVVHPLTSMSVRHQANTVRILVILWVLVVAGHIPLLFDYEVVGYAYYGEDRSTCISKHLANGNRFMLKVYYGSLFLLGYLLPLSFICVLYGLLLKHVLYYKVPGKLQTANSIRSKRNVTKMVLIVVITFALCWLPIQVVFIIQNFGHYSNDISVIAIQMVANCLAYMNSCLNPIIYAILSRNFRKVFRKVCFSE